MYQVPAVREQRRLDRVDEEDVELKWYEGDYECYRQQEQAEESIICQIGI